MTYQFDEIVDRSQNYAAKFEEAVLHYGTNDVIPLWIADMDFRTAPCIVEAIKARADQGIFGYTWRTPRYFETIAAWQQKRNGWLPDVDKDGLCSRCGAGHADDADHVLSAGDKVVIQQPVYHPFADVVENTGRQLVVSPLKRDENGYYTMDYEDFEQKIQGARYFILCNPHNPVGRVWTPEELRKVGELCIRNGVEIISDEIHSDLMLDGHKHTCMASVSPEIAAITTTCIAPSKTFNLAGLQSSTIVFNDEGPKKDAYVAELKRMDIARNNCFSLVATMEAYEQGEEWLEQLLVYLSGNMRFIRDFCADRLPELKPNTPEATYLGVGGSGFLRLNAACPRATIEKALTQLEHAVHSR